MLDSSAILMAVKQETFGTKIMQTRRHMDNDTIKFIRNSRDPLVIEHYEKTARISALMLRRWLRPRLAKKFTVEQHAKFFYKPSLPMASTAVESDEKSSAETEGHEEAVDGMQIPIALHGGKHFSVAGVVRPGKKPRVHLLDSGASVHLVSRK